MGNMHRQVIIETERQTDGKINEIKFIVAVDVVVLLLFLFLRQPVISPDPHAPTAIPHLRQSLTLPVQVR